MHADVVLSDRDRDLFAQGLEDWLPSRVFDAHVHVFGRAGFPAEHEFAPRTCYLRFGGEHTLEQCQAAVAEVLPGRHFGMLSFGTPDPVAQRETMAAYTGEISDNRDRFGMTLVAPEDTVTTLERRIRQYGLIGYKPYRDYVTGMPAEAVRIPDMLTDEQMGLAHELGLAVTLHIPKSRRLADPANQEDMVRLSRRFPNAQIIIAHIGRAYWLDNVVGNLAGISACPNVWLDTAMVNHVEVLEYTLKHFPRERILFGSDAPISWLRGKSVEINNQYAYLMGEDYAIGTTIHDADQAVDFTFFYYEMLRGIRLAAERAQLSRREIEGIFADNAYRLLAGVREGLAAKE